MLHRKSPEASYLLPLKLGRTKFHVKCGRWRSNVNAGRFQGRRSTRNHQQQVWLVGGRQKVLLPLYKPFVWTLFQICDIKGTFHLRATKTWFNPRLKRFWFLSFHGDQILTKSEFFIWIQIVVHKSVDESINCPPAGRATFALDSEWMFLPTLRRFSHSVPQVFPRQKREKQTRQRHSFLAQTAWTLFVWAETLRVVSLNVFTVVAVNWTKKWDTSCRRLGIADSNLLVIHCSRVLLGLPAGAPLGVWVLNAALAPPPLLVNNVNNTSLRTRILAPAHMRTC